MDWHLARMEGQKHVVEVSVSDPADRYLTTRGVHRAVRAKLETSQVLRNSGQQVSLFRSELLDIPHIRIFAIMQRQNRTASWTTRHRYMSNYPLPFLLAKLNLIISRILYMLSTRNVKYSYTNCLNYY